MFSRVLFTIALTATVLVAAVPTPASEGDLELERVGPSCSGESSNWRSYLNLFQRGSPLVVYEHPFFAGARYDITPLPFDNCSDLPNAWNDKISSMTLETTCTFFEYVCMFHSIRPTH